MKIITIFISTISSSVSVTIKIYKSRVTIVNDFFFSFCFFFVNALLCVRRNDELVDQKPSNGCVSFFNNFLKCNYAK